MDFDSRFDCCKACNSISFQCQNNRTPRQTQGQGDCECNAEGIRNVWTSLEKGKKARSKFVRERNQSEQNTERQNFVDGQCFCFTKQDFTVPGRVKQEARNQESCKYFWDSPSPKWTAKSETHFAPEQPKRTDYSNPDKLIAENVSEFEEKANSGQKFPPEGYIEQAPAKPGEGMIKVFGHLFDFNKRLCAAEEGIEKLALILEDLVKDSSKKKTEDRYSDPLDFEEMSVSQRINYLKNRNDLMLSFMKAFLKSGSAEEYYSKLAVLPNDMKPRNSKVDEGEIHQSAELNREKIMETLQEIRMRMTELRQKKTQVYEQQTTRNEKKGETSVKYSRNKLEVISEQAELSLSDESENALTDFAEKNEIRILNEKLSEINEESDESDFSVQDFTVRILAKQENEYLKPPLDKIFSKMDSSENKYLTGSNIQISLNEENRKDDTPANYEPPSELSCFFYDGEKSEKPRDRNQLAIYTKRKVEPVKRDRNFREKSSKDSCKQIGSKKGEDYLETNGQSGRKNQQEDTYAIFHGKHNRGGCTVQETPRSPPDRKREVRRKEQRQRPMTEPSSLRKALPVSKPPLPEKQSRNSGINNVKNKNKMLLSKKSCVGTS